MIQYRTPDITIFESALYRTTSTVIQTGGIILIVDPNCLPAEVARIRQFVVEKRAGRPLYLLFTHSDYDHILGWQAFPEARVIASTAFVENPEKGKCLEQARQFDEEFYIRRDYPLGYPGVDIEINEDEQIVELEGARLRFFLAPGHTADGLFTLVENTGTWIVGDYLSNIEFPFINHSNFAYEQSMQKALHVIREYEPGLLISGHGDATAAKAEMLQRYNESLEYLYQLRLAVQSGEPFPEEELWKRYGNKRGLALPHRENMEFVRKELKGL